MKQLPGAKLTRTPFEAADKLRVLHPHTHTFPPNSPHDVPTQVFLSHLHSDHVADLATLYVAAKYGRTTPLEVWGPIGEAPDMGTAAAVAGLRQVRLWDSGHSDLCFSTSVHSTRALFRAGTSCTQLTLQCLALQGLSGLSTLTALLMLRERSNAACAGSMCVRWARSEPYGCGVFCRADAVLTLMPLMLQFLRWDTVARRRIDLAGRTDQGDTIKAHEFNYSTPMQVGRKLSHWSGLLMLKPLCLLGPCDGLRKNRNFKKF